MKLTGITIPVKADYAELTRTLRIIAKHFTALADELEAPDGLITVRDDTDEEAAEFRERWKAQYGAVSEGPTP